MEEITTSAGLMELRPIWNEIEAAGEPINPFLSWDWQWTWWEAFGGGRRLCCLVVADDREVIGILPLQAPAASDPTWSWVGGTDLSDHLGFLFRPGRADEVASRGLDHLLASGSEAGRMPQLDLHYLLDESPGLKALREAAATRALPSDLTQEEVSPQVSLTGDFEGYLTGQLNKKDRHELRRKLRRLDLESPGWSMVTGAELGLEAALDAFFPLLQASGAHKVEFLTSETEQFIRTACRRLDERGWLRLQFLSLSGELSAATLGFTVSGIWHLYNSGYRPEFGALSPGLLCVAEGIRTALAEGCQSADFLRGSEAYKYHLGAVDRALWRFELAPTPSQS